MINSSYQCQYGITIMEEAILLSCDVKTERTPLDHNNCAKVITNMNFKF